MPGWVGTVLSQDLFRVEAARRLLAEYAHLLDDGEFRSWSQLWDEKGVLKVRGRQYDGRAGVFDYVSRTRGDGFRHKGRHFISNILVELGKQSASVNADFMHVSTAAAPPRVDIVGRYDSDLVWTADRVWRFMRHEVTIHVDRESRESSLR